MIKYQKIARYFWHLPFDLVPKITAFFDGTNRSKEQAHAVRTPNERCPERAGTFFLHLVKPHVPVASGVTVVYGRPEVLGTPFLPVEASPLEPTHLSPPATGTEPTKCTDEEFSRSSKVLY